jgi:hypothetical protein
LSKSSVGKNKAPLPPGTLGLPFIGETLAFIRDCQANKIFEDFVNPRVAKYGQVSCYVSYPSLLKSLFSFIILNKIQELVSHWCVQSIQVVS